MQTAKEKGYEKYKENFIHKFQFGLTFCFIIAAFFFNAVYRFFFFWYIKSTFSVEKNMW